MSSVPRILVVDDNPVVMLRQVELFRAAGMEVAEAQTGAGALSRARALLPDLILLDVVLPDMDGVEVCRRLKADPDLRHLFVVLLSTQQTSSGQQAAGLETGADGYIARPVDNRELVARVGAMLRLQQAEAGLRRAQAELEARVAARTAELSQANARLRALSLRLVEVQEAERRHVARELHDEIGQLLTGLKLLLETRWPAAPAGGDPPGPPGERELRLEALGLLHELLERTRSLSLELRPRMLDDLGLMTALEWQCQRFGKQTGIAVTLEGGLPPGRLPAPAETALFRIAQEALTNVARHARVSEARVRIHAAEGRVYLEIVDGGGGFDPAKVGGGGLSTGLDGMRERAEMLGGRFTLDTAVGAGVRVAVDLPVAGVRAPNQVSNAES